jgi:uncharacterized protein YrrD
VKDLKEVGVMRTSFEALRAYTVHAQDGTLGHIKDLYFDETTWLVRYLAVDTKRWLPGRKVLLSPQAVQEIDHEKGTIDFGLTKAQIEASPTIDDLAPMSQQMSETVDAHYGWHHTWITGGVIDSHLATANFGPIIDDLTVPDEVRSRRRRRGDLGHHLRSVAEIKGFEVRSALPGADGRAGVVADAIVNAVDWRLPYFVVDTSEWLPSHRIVVPTALVETVDLEERCLRIGAEVTVLTHAPIFNGVAELDARQEMAVLAYFFRGPAAPPSGEGVAQPRAPM